MTYKCGYCKKEKKGRSKLSSRLNEKKKLKRVDITKKQEPVIFYCCEFCWLRGQRYDQVSKAIDSQTKGINKCVVCRKPAIYDFCVQSAERYTQMKYIRNIEK